MDQNGKDVESNLGDGEMNKNHEELVLKKKEKQVDSETKVSKYCCISILFRDWLMILEWW